MMRVIHIGKITNLVIEINGERRLTLIREQELEYK